MKLRSGTKRGNNCVVENLPNQDKMLASSNDGANPGVKRVKLETNPMKLGNIVENLMSYLNVEAVKELRRVSKLWSSEGAKHLFKRCCISIPFDHENLLQDAELGNINTEREEFEAFLAHRSSDIPLIPNITVQRDCDFTVWKSLGVLGPQVTYLFLTHIDDEMKLFRPLLKLLPNLTCLNLEGMTSSNFWENKGPGYHIRVLGSIMSAAAKDRAPLLVSSIFIGPENEQDLKDVEKFADCSNIKIVHLNVEIARDDFSGVPTFRARIINIIEKLLSNSRDTLRTLRLLGCDLYLDLLEFPCMTSLGCLDLTFLDRTDGRFAESFKFSKNVPNLVQFRMDYEGREQEIENFLDLFQTTGTAPSVKRFRMDYLATACDDIIDRVYRVFPNIRELEVLRTSLPQEAISSLWSQGGKLRKLGISICLDEYDDALELDSVITGFPFQTVKRIKNRRKLANFEEFRVNPSILNLKKLKALEINLEDNFFGLNGVLAVSGEQAFKLMPNTPVTINFLCKHSMSVLNKVSKLPNVTVTKRTWK